MTSTYDDFIGHARENGIPLPLPAGIREAYAAASLPLPAQNFHISIVLPPDASTGRCCHCGESVAGEQNTALHAVAGFEHTPFRLEVMHCTNCYRSDACDPGTSSPGSGHEGGSPAGFCEYPSPSLTVTCEIVPGARFLAKAIKFGVVALTAAGMALFALAHSQGQQTATLMGTANKAVGIQDAVAGHGYNVGDIKIYTGAAPATANTAESGTMLVDVVLPAQMFGAASAALPSVLTANAIAAATIAATGTAGYGRMLAQGDTGALSTTQSRIQFAVGTSGSDMNFNSLSLVNGGSLTITSLTYQHPA